MNTKEANPLMIEVEKAKYQKLLGMALGIKPSDDGRPAKEVLSSKLSTLSMTVKRESTDIVDVLFEMELLNEYFQPEIVPLDANFAITAAIKS